MVGQMNEGEEALADPQHAEPTTHTVLFKLRELIVTGKLAPDTRLRAEALADLEVLVAEAAADRVDVVAHG